MEELISQQETTFELIKKIGVNFKKTPKARLTKGYIVTRLETLTQYWDQFRTTHLQISKSVTAQEKKELSYFTEDWFDAGEEEYLDIKTDLQDILESFVQSSPQKVYEKTNNHQEVKLPTINIPQFSGSYNEWSAFRDIYTSLIHENKSLSNVQKLHYLKSSLSGDAEQLLKHIPVTESSYENAWTTLTDRYNNKRIIVNSILNKLINQRKLTTATAKGVKELLDTTNECLNNLKSIDVSIENWDILIIHLTVNKLDNESHKSWEEELSTIKIDTLPTLKTFLKFLETRFRVLEMIPTGPAIKEKIFNKPKSFVTNVTSSDTIKCAICKLTNLGVQERVQKIQNARLCFNCLSPKHNAQHCKSNKSCKQCHRRHHTLLHFPSMSNTTQSLNTTPPTTSMSTSTRRAEEPTTSTNRETYENIRTHLYLTRLQQRPKWRTPQKEFQVGDLVLLKDVRYPPSKWMLGRIVAKHPGQDNLTRAYSVRTQSGVYTRTVSKLCPLPEI
ncbi:hypothetical protein ABMA27_002041 [Loxostege sticticalis]|uniref:DUF5641 domain-containing protein n=1 Tax=Loxostege sticticalis TaxID=481309 RepID=A0ABR3HWC1_LOXSC